MDAPDDGNVVIVNDDTIPRVQVRKFSSVTQNYIALDLVVALLP